MDLVESQGKLFWDGDLDTRQDFLTTFSSGRWPCIAVGADENNSLMILRRGAETNHWQRVGMFNVKTPRTLPLEIFQRSIIA